jgi:hypothetical protein
LTDLKEAAILVVQLFSNSTQRYYIIERKGVGLLFCI